MSRLPTPEPAETLTEYLGRFATDAEKAVATLTYRSEAKGVKVLNEETGLLGGWGIPFGGPVEAKDHAAGKDLDGEYFDETTNFCFDWFPNEGRPVLYDHGTDPEVKLDPVGKQVSKFVDSKLGVWVETQLDMANQYAKYILELAKKGVLGYSSGALGGYVRRGTNGKITQWPYIEQTVTVRPANPYALIASDAVKHLKDADALPPEFTKLVETPPPASLADALRPELEIKSDHGDFAGTHAHSHAAFDEKEPSDGKTHSHEHVHSGDAMHDHQHTEAVVTEAKFNQNHVASGENGGEFTSGDGGGGSGSGDARNQQIRAVRGAVVDKANAHIAAGGKLKMPANSGKPSGHVITKVQYHSMGYKVDVATIAKPQFVSQRTMESIFPQSVAIHSRLNSKDFDEHELAIDLDSLGSEAEQKFSSRNMGQLHQGIKAMSDLHGSTCDMGEDCPMYTAPEGKTQDPDPQSGGLDDLPDLETPERKATRQEIDEFLATIKLGGR